MKLFRSIKWLFGLQAAVLALLILASSTRVIQFHYPRGIENNPLLSPLKVQSVSGNTFALEDGRMFQVNTYVPLDEIIKESDFRVDVESNSGSADVVIYAKRRSWICGTPWVGLIEIPLIPDDVPINHREPIGVATTVRGSTHIRLANWRTN